MESKSNVIKLDDYFTWSEIFSHDGEDAGIQFFSNEYTNELEIAQTNNEGECIRICLSVQDADLLLESLLKARKKSIA